MLQIQYDKFGPPSLVANCVKASDPGSPSAWDAIVDIEACPINPSDLSMLAGHYGKLNRPPATIGMEAAGRVVAVGKSVTNLKIGDRVMVMANDNWAQRRKVPATLLHKVPEEINPIQAALMKVNPATALLMLRQQKLNKNDWVIQNAPLSNVGRSVLQVARCQGLRTINIVRRPEAIEEVKQLGGTIVLLQSEETQEQLREALPKEKIKLALDAVAGEATATLADCLDKGGKIISYGLLSGKPCQIGANHLIFRDVQLEGFWLSKILNRMSHQQRTELYDEVTLMVKQGHVHGQIDSCFELAQISEALRRSESPERRGKVILLPNGDIESQMVEASNRPIESLVRRVLR